MSVEEFSDCQLASRVFSCIHSGCYLLKYLKNLRVRKNKLITTAKHPSPAFLIDFAPWTTANSFLYSHFGNPLSEKPHILRKLMITLIEKTPNLNSCQPCSKQFSSIKASYSHHTNWTWALRLPRLKRSLRKISSLDNHCRFLKAVKYRPNWSISKSFRRKYSPNSFTTSERDTRKRKCKILVYWHFPFLLHCSKINKWTQLF